MDETNQADEERFMEESEQIVFTILLDIAGTLSAKLTKPQIIQVFRNTIDKLERL